MSATVIPDLIPSRRTSWRGSPASSRSFSLCQIGLTMFATGRWGHPRVACLLPHRDSRRREVRVGEVADGNGDVSGKAFALPVDRRAAYRTEVKGQRVATFGCSHPFRSVTGEGDLLAAEASLVADHGPGTALALQAVAHGDARWFVFDRKVKLPAAAGGAPDGHGSAP